MTTCFSATLACGVWKRNSLRSAMPTRTSAVVAALACLSFRETNCARFLPAVLVIASRAESTAWQSLAASLLSLRWSEKIFLRSLNVNLPRATLVAWWKQSPCKQHLFLDYFATLVMTKAKMATRQKPLAMTSFHDSRLLSVNLLRQEL